MDGLVAAPAKWAIRVFKLKPAHDFLQAFHNFPPEIFFNFMRRGAYPAEHIYGDGGAGERIAAASRTVDTSAIQKHIAYG